MQYLDYEKLEVYRLAMNLVVGIEGLIDKMPVPVPVPVPVPSSAPERSGGDLN